MAAIVRPIRRIFTISTLHKPWRQRAVSLSTVADSDASGSLSYAHGASSEPLVACTVGRMLRNACDDVPLQDAFVLPAQRVRASYEQLLRHAEQLASSLVSLCGVEKGDRVAIWSENTYEWLVTQYATALCGTILVNVNPGYLADELRYSLRKVGARVLIMSQQYRTTELYELLVAACRTVPLSQAGSIRDEALPQLRHVIVTGLGGEQAPAGTWDYDEVLQAADSASDKVRAELENGTQPDDPANVQFTSGTTGEPKGATLTHHGIMNNARLVGIRTGYRQQHAIICCPPPLYHCFGCVLGSLSAVAHRGTGVFPALSFDPLAALKAVHDERCNSLYGTPTMFIDMLNHSLFDQFDLTSLRYGIMAGAPCPIELCSKLIDRMHMKDFTLLYGATETSPATLQTLRSQPAAERVRSVGLVHEHMEARVVEPAAGAVVPRGVRGELHTRGYAVMLAYWGDEAKTSEVIGPDRWFKSGDLATMSPSGHVQIVGRLKDMIVRGGENVYPTEVEQVLFEHDAVEDVHVVGVPDDRLGEEICAWVRLHRGALLDGRELKAWAKHRMARFKVPKYVMFKDESDFPMTVTGKVQKFRMRDISIAELQLQHVKSHMSFT